MKSIIKILILSVMTNTLNAQIPVKWAQHTVKDTIDVPINEYWDLFFLLNLEDVASAGEYKDLPIIVKTTPVVDTFSEVGHSRRVHFNTGETVLESIIAYEEPAGFAYELSEIEIDLKKVANRARGRFTHIDVGNGRTEVTWTYGFDQKNFIFKRLINRYIKTTHRLWMKDTLAEIKKLTEQEYKKTE